MLAKKKKEDKVKARKEELANAEMQPWTFVPSIIGGPWGSIRKY